MRMSGPCLLLPFDVQQLQPGWQDGQPAPLCRHPHPVHPLLITHWAGWTGLGRGLGWKAWQGHLGTRDTQSSICFGGLERCFGPQVGVLSNMVCVGPGDAVPPLSQVPAHRDSVSTPGTKCHTMQMRLREQLIEGPCPASELQSNMQMAPREASKG